MFSIYKKYNSFFGSRPHNFFQLLLCHSLLPQPFYSTKLRGSSGIRFFLSLPLFVSAMSITSCEKVINIDLNKAEKKYVLEAVITDQDNSCKVLLSETKNFNDNNNFNGVSGAQITIADNNANPVTLTETSAGVYQSATLKGISGHTYNLTVNVAGQVFTAITKMPVLVPLDSLYITSRTIFGKTGKYATIQYTDPAGKGNAYRYIQYVNGVREKTIFVVDDDLSDSRLIKEELIVFTDDSDERDEKKLKTGDSVRVEMLCLDYPIYKYWFSVATSSTGENQSAAPANPVTNIKGGALGYFSAHTYQSKSLIVP